jgi:acyl-CoA dehydrogenase
LQARSSEAQANDIDYLLALGEILTLVACGQLIIESRKFYEVEDDLLDEIFDGMVRDFSKFALSLHMKPSNSEKQRSLSLKMIKPPIPNEKRFEKIWETQVYALKGHYSMNP